MEHYFEMYAATAHALKAVSPRLRVGGPATSEDMINVSATTPKFVSVVAACALLIHLLSSAWALSMAGDVMDWQLHPVLPSPWRPL